MIDPRLAETLIVLISKVEPPTMLKEYRPISLRNVMFKIIMKVLVNHLWPFLSKVIGPFQGSFIRGHGTFDNTIIAQKMIQFVKKEKKVRYLLFKIDLEKAYDRVRWDFLRQTLSNFGFSKIIVTLIMSCTYSSSFILVWNGCR